MWPFLCFVYHEMMCVCETVGGRKFAAAWHLYMWQTVFWVYWCKDAVVSPVPQIVMCVSECTCLCLCVCVCVRTVSCLGVYVWCCLSSRSFPTVTPEAALAERDREREKEGERVPLLSPHTHTLIITIWKLNTSPVLTKLLSASFSTVVYSSRMICCNANTL